jgi:dephospho-CoA kinase
MRLGLTGGIGSGASRAAQRFRELGAKVISADRVGHEVLNWPEIKSELVSAFGNEILEVSGEINRDSLGKLVFTDDHARQILNRVVHPVLLKQVTTLIREAEAVENIVVLDAALIYEWGVQGLFDKVIVVNASRETRLQRLMERDHLTREPALARIDAQMPLTRKVALADYVIENDGTQEELDRQVDEIFGKITLGSG